MLFGYGFGPWLWVCVKQLRAVTIVLCTRFVVHCYVTGVFLCVMSRGRCYNVIRRIGAQGRQKQRVSVFGLSARDVAGAALLWRWH